MSKYAPNSQGMWTSGGQSQPSWWGCDCLVLQDQPFALCGGWFGTASIFSTGLQHSLDLFSAACDQAGIKIAQKSRGIMSRQKPKQCMLQVSGNTLQQIEKFKYFGMVFTRDGRQNKEIDTWIGKANTVLKELYCSGDKMGATNTPKLFNLWISSSDPYLWSWNLGNDCKNPIPSCFFSLRYFGHFFPETVWSLKHFSHLANSCIKTHHNSFH